MNTLLSIGPLNLTPYGLAVLTGVLAGVLLCLLNKKIFPLLPLTILGAVVLGHAFWVFLRLDGYMDEVSSFAFMFQPWLGGYTLYGALIGGALGALAGAKLSGIRPLEALDSLAPAACAVLFFCRIGEYYIEPWGEGGTRYYKVSKRAKEIGAPTFYCEGRDVYENRYKAVTAYGSLFNSA